MEVTSQYNNYYQQNKPKVTNFRGYFTCPTKELLSQASGIDLVNFSGSNVSKAKRLLMPSLYKINDMPWALAMNDVVESAVANLNSNPHLTVTEILRGMSNNGRQRLKALSNNDREKLKHAEGFGILREDPQVIEFRNSYKEYESKVRQSIIKNKGIVYLTYTHKGKAIKLSQLSKDFSRYLSADSTNPNTYDVILETCPLENAHIIVGQRLNKPFERIKFFKKQIDTGKLNKNNKILSNIIDNVSEIHWLISQAWPYKRGSAALSDMTAKVIFDWLKIDITPWNSNINPNIEALITPLPDFKKNYTSLFIRKPKWQN